MGAVRRPKSGKSWKRPCAPRRASRWVGACRLRRASWRFGSRHWQRQDADRADDLRMIVLDTSVVSEPMKARGNPAVSAWLDRQVADTLYFTATSLSELLVGIELLHEGRRRSGLDQALSELVMRLFGPRILPFDQQAATV